MKLIQYLSIWSFILFMIWFGSKTFHCRIHHYLPIQLLVLIIWYGYISIYIFYYKIYKSKEYNLAFFLLNILFHYIPYRIVHDKLQITQRSIAFFLLIVSLYLFYLFYLGINPVNVYFKEKI